MLKKYPAQIPLRGVSVQVSFRVLDYSDILHVKAQ